MATTQENSNTLREEMQTIMNHAHALVDATSGEIDDKITAARTALKERLDLSRSDFRNIESQILDKVQAADEFIHVKPYYAIGGTFVGALLLGWFMARK
ncbi:MAG: DUF883 family protein [Desulfobulbaceae bacterium]|jgi:ElaB/YqjD/DUF883 family membrane-anchored ribosome-binding protein|nr:DUF883 family protein [Desulfobulbaceae bacterium]